MKLSEPDEERPLAWKAILENTPAISSDGEETGTVVEVLGLESADIFHGIVIGHGVPRTHVFVPADSVAAITNRRVRVALTAEQIRALPPYQDEHSYTLGFVGLFRKRLGWVEERDEHE